MRPPGHRHRVSRIVKDNIHAATPGAAAKLVRAAIVAINVNLRTGPGHLASQEQATPEVAPPAATEDAPTGTPVESSFSAVLERFLMLTATSALACYVVGGAVMLAWRRQPSALAQLLAHRPSSTGSAGSKTVTAADAQASAPGLQKVAAAPRRRPRQMHTAHFQAVNDAGEEAPAAAQKAETLQPATDKKNVPTAEKKKAKAGRKATGVVTAAADRASSRHTPAASMLMPDEDHSNPQQTADAVKESAAAANMQLQGSDTNEWKPVVRRRLTSAKSSSGSMEAATGASVDAAEPGVPGGSVASCISTSPPSPGPEPSSTADEGDASSQEAESAAQPSRQQQGRGQGRRRTGAARAGLVPSGSSASDSASTSGRASPHAITHADVRAAKIRTVKPTTVSCTQTPPLPTCKPPSVMRSESQEAKAGQLSAASSPSASSPAVSAAAEVCDNASAPTGAGATPVPSEMYESEAAPFSYAAATAVNAPPPGPAVTMVPATLPTPVSLASSEASSPGRSRVPGSDDTDETSGRRRGRRRGRARRSRNRRHQRSHGGASDMDEAGYVEQLISQGYYPYPMAGNGMMYDPSMGIMPPSSVSTMFSADGYILPNMSPNGDYVTSPGATYSPNTEFGWQGPLWTPHGDAAMSPNVLPTPVMFIYPSFIEGPFQTPMSAGAAPQFSAAAPPFISSKYATAEPDNIEGETPFVVEGEAPSAAEGKGAAERLEQVK